MARVMTILPSIGVSVKRTLIRAYARLSSMGETVRLSGETIRLSEEFYAWVESRQRDDESLEEALHRLVRGPRPEETTGLFTPEEAREIKEAVKRLRENDAERKRRAREAFSEDG